MVQRDVDPLTGADRDDVLISADDLARLGLRRRRRASRCARRTGIFDGPAARRADQAAATSRCTGPRATCCSPARRIDPESLEPDYNAVVTIEAAGSRLSARAQSCRRLDSARRAPVARRTTPGVAR